MLISCSFIALLKNCNFKIFRCTFVLASEDKGQVIMTRKVKMESQEKIRADLKERKGGSASEIQIEPARNLKKWKGRERAETKVEANSNSDRRIERETNMRSHIKTGIK